jgi:DNA-binding beta-propeller fold protein YncE
MLAGLLALGAAPVILAQDDTVPADLQSRMQNLSPEDFAQLEAGQVNPWDAEKIIGGHVVDFGIVAVLQGYIRMIDLGTMTLSPPMLKGQLGPLSGGLLDVVITPDNRTALVSNFGASRVYFVDITNPMAPYVRRSANVGFFAEDIDITRDGKYALVTDGGLASQVAVLDVVSGRVRQRLDLGANDAQAVAMSPDGQTVLCADYWGRAVHVLVLNRWTGQLSYQSSIDLLPYMPVNVTFSPDGRTALVGTAWGEVDADGVIVAVLRIDKGSRVIWTDTVILPEGFSNIQSAVFTNDGQRAYFIADEYIGEDEKANGEIFYINRIYELAVLGPGQVESTGRVTPVNFYGSGSFFGVDTLAVDPYDTYLFVSNKTSGNPQNALAVIHLLSMNQVKTLRPGTEMDDYPTGVSFIRGLLPVYPRYTKNE